MFKYKVFIEINLPTTGVTTSTDRILGSPLYDRLMKNDSLRQNAFTWLTVFSFEIGMSILSVRLTITSPLSPIWNASKAEKYFFMKIQHLGYG